jgi:hypothetical protein
VTKSPARTSRTRRRPSTARYSGPVEDADRQKRARRGSLAQAALARAALDDHDLEAAASAATETAKLAAHVQSPRSIDAVVDLRNRLQPHNDSPVVQDFLQAAAVLLPA